MFLSIVALVTTPLITGQLPSKDDVRPHHPTTVAQTHFNRGALTVGVPNRSSIPGRSAEVIRSEAAVAHKGFGVKAGAPWPKFGQNASNTGAGTSGGSNGQWKWYYPTSDAVYNEPAIDADGTIYFGCRDGFFYALRSDGSTKWSEWIGSLCYTVGAPVIGSDGTIYFGVNIGYADGAYCFWALNPDGSPKFAKYGTGGYCSPAIGAGGTTYWGLGNGSLRALDANGAEKWTFTPPFCFSALTSSPVVGADGTIYFGSANQEVYALNPDGTVKWEYKTGNPISTALSLDASGTVRGVNNAGTAFALDANGNLKWSLDLGALGYSVYASGTALATDGTMYVGTYLGGSLIAIDKNGAIKWAFKTSGTITTSPAIGTDGTVYIGNSEYNGTPGDFGALYAINPDGSLQWKRSSTGSEVSSVAIGSDGTLYVGSDNAVNGFGMEAIGTQSSSVPAATLTLDPNEVFGGDSSTGTVTISSPAPAGGDIVTLSATDPSISLPPFVTVAGGSTTANFTLNTTNVASDQLFLVTASSGGTNRVASLKVKAKLASIKLNAVSVVGGNQPVATITLGSAAPIGGLVVTLSSNDPSVTMPPAVTVPAGNLTTTCNVVTHGVDVKAIAKISATVGPETRSVLLNVLPAWPFSMGLSPATVTSGSTSTGTITLNGEAGPSGSIVNLSSTDNVAAPVPLTVTVAAYAKKASFTIQTGGVGAASVAQISGTLNNNTSSASLTVNAAQLSSVSTNQIQIVGGNSPTGTVTLNGAAPAGGANVTLTSSDASLVVPASVTVPAGLTSAKFAVTTSGVDSSLPVTVSATLGVTKSCSITLLPATLLSIDINPSTVVGGQGTPITAKIAVNGKAGPSGINISLSNPSPLLFQTPSLVKIPAGAYSVSVSCNANLTAFDQNLSVKATQGALQVSTNVSVLANGIASVKTSPLEIVGGNLPNGGTVTLVSPAPIGGKTISLSSSDPSVVVPASITIPQGASTGNFGITTSGVDVKTSVNITATMGASSKKCQIDVDPATPFSVTFSSSVVHGGVVVTGTVTMNGQSGPSGIVVSLSSSNGAVASVPASVTVPAFIRQKTFTVTTFAVGAQQTVTITALANGKSVGGVLTVNP